MRMDKSRMAVLDKDDDSSARSYWAGKTEEERISAVEFLRSQMYAIAGHSGLPRLQRVIRVTDRSGSTSTPTSPTLSNS